MKHLFLGLLLAVTFTFSVCAQGGNTNTAPEGKVKIKITIGTKEMTATMRDNAAAKAFLDLLPVTVDMSELNGNEKYYYLKDKLPAAAEPVGSITAGDLMLYGSDCLVLFYKNFATAYRYTRLGVIEDVSGLAAALGNGNVHLRFSAVE